MLGIRANRNRTQPPCAGDNLERVDLLMWAWQFHSRADERQRVMAPRLDDGRQLAVPVKGRADSLGGRFIDSEHGRRGGIEAARLRGWRRMLASRFTVMHVLPARELRP